MNALMSAMILPAKTFEDSPILGGYIDIKRKSMVSTVDRGDLVTAHTKIVSVVPALDSPARKI